MEREHAGMNGMIRTKVIEQPDALAEYSRRQVLAFVRPLQPADHQGVPGKQLLEFAGAIPADDLELMRAHGPDWPVATRRSH
jgi:hypothetical protein